MDLNTTLYDCLVRHPEIESVQDIPAEDRRAIYVAFEQESEPGLIAELYRGNGWNADEHENQLFEQMARACSRAVGGREEDEKERDRLIFEWVWRQAEEHIEEALQDVRAEEAA